MYGNILVHLWFQISFCIIICFWCISDPKSVSALSSVKFAIGEYIDIDNWCVSELNCFLPFKPHSFGLPVYHGMNVDEYSTKIPPPPFLFWWTVAWRKAIVVEIYQREVDFSLCFKCERHISGGSCIWLVTLQLMRYVFFYAFVNNLLASWSAVVEAKVGQG